MYVEQYNEFGWGNGVTYKRYKDTLTDTFILNSPPK